jgi:cytochrome c5
MRSFVVAIVLTTVFVASMSAQHTYVGVKTCKMCHQAESKGKQFGIWQKSKHAEAFKALSSAKAVEIAKAKGLKKSAAETPECMQCHGISTEPALMADGVQCEVCHGPGSDYKSMSIMKDSAKAVAAGLIVYKDKAAIEKKCRTCHNEKSPTFPGFKFEEMWAKIKHPVPKG